MFKKNKELLFLLIILAIASFFRLWQLDSIPPGLYPDVAMNGNDALETLKTFNFKVFYPENNGREGLMMWLIALSFSIFGVSVWSIKIVAAVIGILTVLGLYLLTKELLKTINNQQLAISNEVVALLASFFLAISFWHVNFSRIGFRAILLPFVLVFGFYFLFKGFRHGSAGSPQAKTIFNFIVSGIFFGLGFYTYISYRFIVFLLPIILICWLFIYRKQNIQRKFLLSTFYLLFSIFVIALPIGIHFLSHSQDFVGRAAPISIFAAENPIKEFNKSLILHLGMFNFYGDSNWRHNFSGSPMLPLPIGILFLIGFVISIKNFISSLKNKNCFMFHVPCLLTSWFFAMLLPGILTYEGVPHALRTIGVIPVVYIFAALGGLATYEWLKKAIKNKNFLPTLCLLFFLFLTLAEFHKYFYQWAGNPETEGAFSKNYVKIGAYLNSLSGDIQKYVIVNQSGVPVPFPEGLPMPAQTIMFIENTKYGSPRSVYLLPEDLNQIKIEKETVIIPMGYDKDLFNELYQRFPQGEAQEKEEIWIYSLNFE